MPYPSMHIGMPEANHPDLTALLARMERLDDELSKAKAQLAKTKDELALAIVEIKRKDYIIEGLRVSPGKNGTFS